MKGMSLLKGFVALVVFLLGSQTATAEGKNIFLHLKTGITQDDNQMCAAFNIALAGLEAGHHVEMFFDAAAVFDLQNASGEAEGTDSKPTSKPTSKPVDGTDTTDERPYNLRYKMPDDLKQILADQFSIPKADLPADYFGYLKMLQDRGAHITFNGVMAHLVSLSESVKGTEKMTDIATPLDLREIVQHRQKADTYFVY